jgi:hypothetical protein
MYTCFCSSSLATRCLVGAISIVVGLLVALCIRTGWTKQLSKPDLLSPSRGDLSESRGATPAPNEMHDVEPRGRTADTLPRCSDSAEDEKQGANRQRSWALRALLRKPTSDSHIQVDHNEGQKAEV